MLVYFVLALALKAVSASEYGAKEGLVDCKHESQIVESTAECADGYEKDRNGICVPKFDTSKVSCPENQTYVYCNAGCPTFNCPVDDNRAFFACSPPNPCPPGCACQEGYKRISYEDTRCILASECKPVECTRKNEKWHSCPPPCFSDSCRNIKKVDEECSDPFWSCQPQCVCEEGYARIDSSYPELCVPIEECPTYKEITK